MKRQAFLQAVKNGVLHFPIPKSGGSGNGIRILLFHEIEENQFQKFESLVRLIHETYGFMNPRDFEQGPAQGIRFIISFDDGFLSQYEAAKRLLEPLGIKALFFVCPDYVELAGNEALQFAVKQMGRTDLNQMTPDLSPMTWTNLGDLTAAGHVIGSHGLSHLKLSRVREQRKLIHEISRSAEVIGAKLGPPCAWFAYPFGDINSIDPVSLRSIRQSYRYCCSGLRGLNGPDTNKLCLARESLDLGQPLENLVKIAFGKLDLFYYFKRRKLCGMLEQDFDAIQEWSDENR